VSRAIRKRNYVARQRNRLLIYFFQLSSAFSWSQVKFVFILKNSFSFRVSGTGEYEDSDEQLLQCLMQYENATTSEDNEIGY